MKLTTLLMVVCCGCWSTARPAAPRRTTELVLPVDQFALPNGMRVVVVPEPSAGEVAITLRYGGGMAADPVGRGGLAHLAEHVMFDLRRGERSIADELAGAALAFNGETTLDATIYTARVEPARLADALELEAARAELPCADVPAATFAVEREIVRNELRERSGATAISAALRSALFAPGHAWTQAPASPDAVAAYSQDEVCAFAAAHQRPGNAVLVVSGDITAAAVRPMLERTLGRLPAGDAAALPGAPGPRAGAREVSIAAPVDRTWVVLAWRLPADPAERARVRGVAEMLRVLVANRVDGDIDVIELGAGAERRIAIAIAPGTESPGDAIAGARQAIGRIGEWSATGLYEYVQRRALIDLARSFDHGADRDRTLADEVAAGGDARAAVAAEVTALRELGRDRAETVARTAFDPAAAVAITLQPEERTTEPAAALGADVREETPRSTEDPAAANAPAPPGPASPLDHVLVHTMANGLRLVMLPLSTMATVDVRLVVPVGSGDEAEATRGVTRIAAEALAGSFDADALRFMQAGGRVARDVTFDHTVFGVTGLASELDLMLGGLAATVRDGAYASEDVREASLAADADARRDREASKLSAAWQAALYGAHPYAIAGRWEHAASAAGDVDALRRFHARYVVPAGATLVITGRFDPADATRWAEFAFGAWTGTPPARLDRRAPLVARALAAPAATAQVGVELAFELPPGSRVAGQVATALVEQAIGDVRRELGATYGLHARLVEARLGDRIIISGFVAADRASPGFTLLRDRLARLRTADPATASAFVAARRHVIAALVAPDTRAGALADALVAETDASARPGAADRARALTLPQLAPALAALDLDDAALLLRGPDAALAAAFRALGREPRAID